MTGTRALLRLAVRDARRDRWRSLLVVVLVALPVAGLVTAAIVTDTLPPSGEERATARLGAADLGLQLMGDGLEAPDETLAELRDRLPADATSLTVRSRGAGIAIDGVQVPVTVADAPLDAGALSAGRLELVDGAAPAAPDAVAVSGALLERGVAIGDTIELDPLGAVTVVGEVRDPAQLSRAVVAAAPGTLADDAGATPELLVGLPGGMAGVDLGDDVLMDQGTATDPVAMAATRDGVVAERFTEGERFVLVVVGGLVAVEVALVAGAAFAVSVRRRQRELGLLAATGATRRHVRRSVLLTGAAVGLAGAAIGTALGLAIALAASPWFDRLADRAVGVLQVDVVWLLGAAAIGVVAATLGAWLPARSVARLPVVVALSGRRPPATSSRRSLAAGSLLVVTGTIVCTFGSLTLGGATPFVFLAGAVAIVLGAGLASPWLLEQLGRTARFLPPGPRLAVRDAARFRTRNGPIVTAAMAGLAASVTIATVLTSDDATARAVYEPRLPADVLVVDEAGFVGAADTIADALDVEAHAVWGTTSLPVAVPEADGRASLSQAVDPALVTALFGAEAGRAAQEGAAVTYLDGDEAVERVELRTWDEGADDEVVVAELPVHHVADHPAADLDVSFGSFPPLLVPRDAVPGEPGPLLDHVLVLDGPVDDATLRAAGVVAAELGDAVTVRAEQGYQSIYATALTVVTVGGALAGLLLVAVAIALAAAEARNDLRTLTAVGAGRRTRRTLAAGRALLLAGLGGVLAVPVGLLPALALERVRTGPSVLALPWPTLLVVTVVVPALACLGALVVSRREPRALRRAA